MVISVELITMCKDTDLYASDTDIYFANQVTIFKEFANGMDTMASKEATE